MSSCRWWQLHPISIGSFIFLLGAFTLVNLYPRVYFWNVDFDFYVLDDQYAHGWPLVYMLRDCQVANADMGGRYHSPWLFAGTSPIRQFEVAKLIFDALACTLLVAFATNTIDAILRQYEIRFRFGLSIIFAFVGFLCLLLAIERQGRLLRLAVHVLPNYIILFSLGLAGFSIAMHLHRFLVGRVSKPS